MTFQWERFDVTADCIGSETYEVPDAEGEYVKAEDAINREAVNAAEIATLKVQLKVQLKDARKAPNRLCHEWVGNKCRHCGIIYQG